MIKTERDEPHQAFPQWACVCQGNVIPCLDGLHLILGNTDLDALLSRFKLTHDQVIKPGWVIRATSYKGSFGGSSRVIVITKLERAVQC